MIPSAEATHTSVSAALADARALVDADLVDAIANAENALRRQQAELAALMCELDSRLGSLGYPMSGAADELATMLTISARSAERRMGDAVALCDREVVWAGLHDGRIDSARAAMIIDLLAHIPDPRREELELAAIEFGATHTPHHLRHRLLAWTCEADPDDSLRREAIDRRGVWITPTGHGMADIHAHLSAEHAEFFMQALEKLAAAEDCADPYAQGDDRTAEQRRADALVGYVLDHTVVDIRVDVVISADSLIGDNDWTPQSKRLGPVNSQVARELCMHPDARWRRLVTDPVTGELVALGTSVYRIPDNLRQGIRARDLTCRFPGCHTRAEHLDCDHTIPHPHGPTSAENLAGLCRRHHRTKTFTPWKVRRDPDSATHELIWTSPLGRQYRTQSHPYRQG